VPIPKEDFPHENDTASFRKRTFLFYNIGYILVGLLSAVGVAGIYAFQTFKRRH
jgi:hypothetical protein